MCLRSKKCRVRLLMWLLAGATVLPIWQELQAQDNLLLRDDQDDNTDVKIPPPPATKKTAATQNRAHVITIGTMLQLSYGLDKGYSHMTRTVFLGGGQLGYDYRGSKVQNEFSFGGGTGTANLPYIKATEVPGTSAAGATVPAPDTAIYLQLADALLFHFKNKKTSSPWRFSLGAELSFVTSFWIPADRLNYSFFLALELRPLARLQWRASSQHKFWLDLTFPLLGIGWRPPWTGLSTLLEKNLEEGGVVGALFSYPYFLSGHNNQGFRLRLNYDWQLGPGFALSVRYEHHLQRNQAVQPYIIFNNRLYLGIEIKPGRRQKK